MNLKMKRWFIPVLLTVFLSGCASVPLKYEHPQLGQSPSTGPTIAVIYPVDQRTDKSMDKKLKNNIIDDLDTITVEEVRSTGIFREVIPVPKGTQPANGSGEADLIMNTCLKNIDWKVPTYRELKTQAFVVGLAFGLAGGLIWGATRTDVDGDASLRITVVKKSTGEKLIDKDYTAQVNEKMAKLDCDSPKTQSLMAGKALKSAMDKFKTDLEKTIASMRSVTHVSSTSKAQ